MVPKVSVLSRGRAVLAAAPWLVPTALFAVLIVWGATLHPLWGDEAETALFARSILASGLPRGWDGVNLMGINDAITLDMHLINHTSPWAQYYLAAASFAIFGESSLAARMPFVALSILSFPLFYRLALAMTRERRIALLAVFILALCVPYVLFAYQARYYAISLFSALAWTAAALSLARGWSWRGAVAFVASGVLYFYGNYVSFASLAVAVFLAALLFLRLERAPRSRVGRFVVRYVGLGAVVAACCLPWLLLLRPFAGRGGFAVLPAPFFWRELLFDLRVGIAPYHESGVFPLLFLPALAVIIVLKRRRREPLGPLLLAVAIPAFHMAFMLLITSATLLGGTLFTNIRYTVAVFPFLALLSAWVVHEIWKWNRWLGVVVFLVLLSTNALTLTPPRSFLWEFLQEALHPYPTPNAVVAAYLRTRAREGDTAFVNLDSSHEPIIFFLGKQLRFVNRVTPTNRRIFPQNRGVLPPYLYHFLDDPDWVILYSKHGDDGSFIRGDYRGEFPRGLAPTVDLARAYDETVLPVYFTDTSRPELYWHAFREVVPSGPDFVYVYHRKGSPDRLPASPQ